jgi:Neprosin
MRNVTRTGVCEARARAGRPLRRRAVGAAIALAVPLAIGAAASSALPASAATSHAAVTKVKCVKRPAIKPPPRGPVRPKGVAGVPSPGAAPAAASIKPVCPRGQVPVLKLYRRGLPKGNPELSRKTGSEPARRVNAACAGVVYPSDPAECYYYAGASDSRTDQGGGLTTTIEKPSYNGTGGPGHSLEEMSVQGGKGNGNIVEIGSSVSTDQFGNAAPHLFVFHWISWNPSCYSCDFHQYSNTYYPGMDLSALAGHSVYNGYVYYQGNWWAWFNDQWVGYFPGTLWKGQFQTSQQVQWFGEVATQNGVPPLTQMGNGLFASNAAAAPMSTLCDVNAAAWVCFYYDQQSLQETQAKFYSIAHTGFGAIRLGGPGH